MRILGEKLGIVFGCYAPMHQGHLELILRAKKECDAGVMIIVCGDDNDRGTLIGLSLKKRYELIKEYFKNDEYVYICMIDESTLQIDEYPNGWDKWLKEVHRIYQDKYVVNEKIWYVGEPDYKIQLSKRNEQAILVDRNINDISATKIRNNPIKYFNKIVPTFRPHFSYNILITGTASEGKSTLVSDLSKYYFTASSVEYGKENIIKTNNDERYLTVNDYLSFLDNQYLLTKNGINSLGNQGIFFGDTDNLVTLMYAKYYSMDPDFILTIEDAKKIEEAAFKYNFLYKWNKIYLIMPHNKFVLDGVRYEKHAKLEIRYELYNILCDLIKKSGLWDKVEILDGTYYENFKKIVDDTRELI